MTSLEPWPSAMSKPRPFAQRASAKERSNRPSAFAASAAAAVVADRVVLDAEAVAQRERLREVARGDLDLGAAAAQLLDHRAA